MSETVIDTRNLGVRFGDHQAIQEVTFALERGAFMAVLGPNGSGKTTLIKALLGLLEPSGGWVKTFGQPPGHLAARHVGYVPQIKTYDRTFPAESIELVVSGLRQGWPYRIHDNERQKALAVLRQIGAEGLAFRSLSSLSGGELQRVYLARSLVRSPDLLLLDEPATGIDVGGAADLLDLIESYGTDRRLTIVMVTHDWNVAYHHANRVLVLNRKQVSFGTPDEALQQKHLREAFGHVGHAHLMFKTDTADD